MTCSFYSDVVIFAIKKFGKMIKMFISKKWVLFSNANELDSSSPFHSKITKHATTAETNDFTTAVRSAYCFSQKFSHIVIAKMCFVFTFVILQTQLFDSKPFCQYFFSLNERFAFSSRKTTRRVLLLVSQHECHFVNPPLSIDWHVVGLLAGWLAGWRHNVEQQNDFFFWRAKHFFSQTFCLVEVKWNLHTSLAKYRKG